MSSLAATYRFQLTSEHWVLPLTGTTQQAHGLGIIESTHRTVHQQHGSHNALVPGGPVIVEEVGLQL
jgi:hypothetical protein